MSSIIADGSVQIDFILRNGKNLLGSLHKNRFAITVIIKIINNYFLVMILDLLDELLSYIKFA